MKIKSLLALVATATVGIASAAEVSTDNTLVRIKVNSGLESTIVAVPVVQVGGELERPTNYIDPSHYFAVADSMFHWTGSAWEAWTVANDSSAGTWSWDATATVNDFKNITVGDSTTFAPGDAVWVNRDTTHLNSPYYIYGQVTNVTSYTLSAAGINLVANMKLADQTMYQITQRISNATSGDEIIVGTSDTTNYPTGKRTVTYNGTEWGYNVPTVYETTSGKTRMKNVWTTLSTENPGATVPAGQGFWYKAGATGVTFTWSD